MFVIFGNDDIDTIIYMLDFIVVSLQSPLATNGDDAISLVVNPYGGRSFVYFGSLATYNTTFDWHYNFTSCVNKAYAIFAPCSSQTF